MKRLLPIALALVLLLGLLAVPAVAVPSGSIIQDRAFYGAVLEIIWRADGYVITAGDVSWIE